MYQNKIVFHAELFVYPTIVGGSLVYDLDRSGFALHLRWWFAAVSGMMLWTLAEYLVHRFVYHKVPIVRDLHGMHHSRPRDLIGAPIWVSIVSFPSFFFLLALLCDDVEIASGTTSGLIVGYVLYLLIHNAVHRWQLDEKSWIHSHRLRHLRHHYHPVPGNFGVTTGIWDLVFGTAIAPERTHTGRADFSGPRR
ncbi:sterol desaturase family protein [Bradyrhizobium genosp. P]|uniref:sterol desaturase family protein n=1 Tax=Bradyrhizobium genosp. P TaxID=83641 RepID=UPI003CE9B85A